MACLAIDPEAFCITTQPITGCGDGTNPASFCAGDPCVPARTCASLTDGECLAIQTLNSDGVPIVGCTIASTTEIVPSDLEIGFIAYAFIIIAALIGLLFMGIGFFVLRRK